MDWSKVLLARTSNSLEVKVTPRSSPNSFLLSSSRPMTSSRSTYFLMREREVRIFPMAFCKTEGS